MAFILPLIVNRNGLSGTADNQAPVGKQALLEKCPDTEFFLVRIRENKDQNKLRIWTLFTQVGQSRNQLKLRVLTVG